MLSVQESIVPGNLAVDVNTFASGGSPTSFVPCRWIMAQDCLLYTSPSPRDRTRSRMPSSA